MSERVDIERSLTSAESKSDRARRRIRECGDVNRLTEEGLSVTLIAERLCFSRHKVRVIQFWLGWRNSKMKWALRAKAAPGWVTRYPDDHGEMHTLQEPKSYRGHGG